MPDAHSEIRQFATAMETFFEKYRICKYLAADDHTRNVQKYRDFCQYVEESVHKLPDGEKNLITVRYMKDDNVTDTKVFKEILHISASWYDNLRIMALNQLNMDLEVYE
jgi:DNA-directed RNA polymerase specialized sigma subunit